MSKKNLKENLKIKMKKIPVSKRGRPKDVERLLDEDLDNKCQRRKFYKCEKGRRGILLFIGNEAWPLKRRDQP